MTRRRSVAVAWAAAMALVLAGLGLQVRYADGTRECLRDDLLALCQGPLDWWVTPLTLLAGGVLVIIGLWLAVANQNSGERSDQG